MPIVTVIIGALLTALGLWGRFGTEHGQESITSLIPAFVGAPLVLLGLLALKESYLKHAMHAAAALGLLGFLAACGNLVRTLVSKGTVTGEGGLSTVLMTVLCGLFVALCVNSFVQTRRRRRAQQALSGP